MTVSSPPASASTRELEVKLLADMVRLSRVTLLIAEPGSEKSAFIKSDVMPRLNEAKASGKAEMAILFDAWGSAPLAEVCARIHQVAGAGALAVSDTLPAEGALGASLKAWQDKLGVTFLIIFDRFEEYLRARATRVDMAQFEEELVRVVNDPGIRANFLLSLEEEAEPLLLSRLRDRIPRLGYSRVRLPRAAAGSAAKTSEPAQAASQPQPALSLRIASVPPTAMPITASAQAPSSAGATATAPTAPTSAGEKPAQQGVNTLATSIQRAIAARAAALESPPAEVRNPETVRKTVAAQPVTNEKPVQETAKPSLVRKPAALQPLAGENPVQEAPKASPVKKPSVVQSPVTDSPVQKVLKAAPVKKPVALEPPAVESPIQIPKPAPARKAATQAPVTESPVTEVNKTAAFQKTVVAAQAPAPDGARNAQKTPVLQKPVVAPPERETLKAPEPIASALVSREPGARTRRLVWFSWAAAALCVVGVVVVFQPGLQSLATRVAQSVSTWSAATFTRSGAEAEPARSPSLAAQQQAYDATPAPPAASPAPSSAIPLPTPASPPSSTAAAGTAEQPQRQVNAASEKSRPPARVSSAAAALALKQAEIASSKSISAQPPTRGIPPAREAVAPPKPLAGSASPPAATAQAFQRAPQSQVVVNAAPAPVPAAAPVEVPTGPRLYINVRNEAQRAWAQQMIRPLGERGIRVAGIRVVDSGPDEADVRYYHLNQRDEALKVALALRDFGLRAQQLRHVDEGETVGTSRQYELWLPATGYDQRP